MSSPRHYRAKPRSFRRHDRSKRGRAARGSTSSPEAPRPAGFGYAVRDEPVAQPVTGHQLGVVVGVVVRVDAG